MGTRSTARHFHVSARILAVSLATSLVMSRPAVGEPGDIFTVAAPASTAPSAGATSISTGDASVATQTGALTFGYPIPLPPGRGVTPSLALHYSSQAPIYGSSVGAGWSFGVPMIYEDTSGGRLAGGKVYASSMAGGSQLFAVDEPGAGVRYRAMRDTTWTRYERHTDEPFWWRASTPDGTTFYFGDKDGHTSGCPTVSDGFAPLTREVDAFGNAIDYVYEAGVDGECRLRAITWGQNANAGIGYFAAVELTYTASPQTCAGIPVGSQTSYRSGTKIVSGASQLDQIRIAAFPPASLSSVNTSPIPSNPAYTRTITLVYSSTASSCSRHHAPYRELTSIHESAVGVDQPAVTLPAVDFTYGDASLAYPPGPPTARSVPWVDLHPSNLGWGYRSRTTLPTVEAMMIDVNGDGLIDRIRSEPFLEGGHVRFCRAHWDRNTGTGFVDAGTINIPTLKWATEAGAADAYKGGAYAGANPDKGAEEHCALNYQHTAYRNSIEGGGAACAPTFESCPAAGYCTAGRGTASSGYGTDCGQAKSNPPGDTYFAWRWMDVDGDHRVDLVGSPMRGGLDSYDLQFGLHAPGTTQPPHAEPAIFGAFPACPQDRSPSSPSYTSFPGDSFQPYTMCGGMFPYFVYKNHGNGEFGRAREPVMPPNDGDPPPVGHQDWGPLPDEIMYQPLPLESAGGDSSITSAPVGEFQGTIDIDGDSSPDGVYAQNTTWDVWRNNGFGQLVPQAGTANPLSFGSGSGFALFRTDVSLSTSTPIGTQGLEDINGDGMLDHWVATSTGSQTAFIQLNDGIQFRLGDGITAHRPGTDGYPEDIAERDGQPNYFVTSGRRIDARRVLDVDADGRSDIVRFADGTTSPTIELNTGGQFGSPAGGIGLGGNGLLRRTVASDQLAFPALTWEIRSDMIDLDGDGLLESVDFGDTYTEAAATMLVSRQPTPVHPPRLLHQIVNHQGATTTVSYAPIHSSTVSFDPGRTFPVNQWVVASMTTVDSFANTSSTTSYHYKNPMFSPALEGPRIWGFRGFNEVETTRPSGARTVERFVYAPDWTGRLTTTLVYPAATDRPALVPGEVRSIDDTRWERRSLFGDRLRTYHATVVDHRICKNGQDEATCRASTDTRTRTETELVPLTVDSVAFMWVMRATTLRTGVQAADGDRRTETDTTFVASDSMYRVRDTAVRRYVQEGATQRLIARTASIWDANLLVPVTNHTWVDGDDSHRTISRMEYDLQTGNLVRQWRPEQWAANPDPSSNLDYTSLEYDSRKLFVVRENGPPPSPGQPRQGRDYVYEYGTGAKLETLGPNVPPCAAAVPATCPAGQPLRETHRVRVDALGRAIERWETFGRPGGSYALVRVEANTFVDIASGAVPRSVTHLSAIDHDEVSLVPRYKQDKTELDGHGRVTRATTSALGSAPNDQVSIYRYRDDGTLAETLLPDPSANNASLVSYHYAFDSLGRLTSTRRPDSVANGSGTDIAYDGLTQTTTQVTGAFGGAAGISLERRDAFGRVVEVAEYVNQQLGTSFVQWASTTYDYDASDNTRRVVTPEGVTTCVYHDLADRRTAIFRPNTRNAVCPATEPTGDQTWHYGYDRNNNVISQITPCTGMACANYVSTIAYDALDRPISKLLAHRELSTADVALFGADHEVFRYDTAPNGIGTPSGWSSFGSVGAATPVLTSDVAYDAQGHTASQVMTARVAGYAPLQRRIDRRHIVSGALAETVFHDVVGTRNCQDGSRAAYRYDARGLPSEVTLDTCANTTGAPVSTIVNTHNVAGLVTRQASVVGTGPFTSVVSTWTYDTLARVTSQATVKGSTGQLVARQDLAYFGNDDPRTLDHWLGAANRKQFAFAYDARHQIESATEVTTPRYFTARYGYGADGRLRTATEDSSLPKGSTVVPRDVSYQYGGTDPEQVTALIDVQKQKALMSYAFDRAGNQTTRCYGTLTGTSCSGKSLGFVYDGRNQLRRITARNASGRVTGSEEYWYDQAGSRTHVVKRDASGTTKEMIWFLGEVEAHYDGTGSVTRAFGHVGFGAVAARFDRSSDAASSLEYQVHGLANNTIAAIDQKTGTVTATFSYAPFGEIVESTSSGGDSLDTHRRLLNDKYVDEISELAYYGARYYDRLAMQWSQSDPAYRMAPDRGAAVGPRRANLYQFSLANPLRFMDPNGQDSFGTNNFFAQCQKGSLCETGNTVEGGGWGPISDPGETLLNMRRDWARQNAACGCLVDIARATAVAKAHTPKSSIRDMPSPKFAGYSNVGKDAQSPLKKVGRVTHAIWAIIGGPVTQQIFKEDEYALTEDALAAMDPIYKPLGIDPRNYRFRFGYAGPNNSGITIGNVITLDKDDWDSHGYAWRLQLVSHEAGHPAQQKALGASFFAARYVGEVTSLTDIENYDWKSTSLATRKSSEGLNIIDTRYSLDQIAEYLADQVVAGMK
jgi:RHS repeat-associated protein